MLPLLIVCIYFFIVSVNVALGILVVSKQRVVIDSYVVEHSFKDLWEDSKELLNMKLKIKNKR